MTIGKRELFKAALLGSTAAVLAFVALDAGIAQAADDDEGDVEEVTVTGTRFKNPNISSPSPVTVIGGAEIDSRGNVLVEEMLGVLPQTFTADSTGDFGASGVATVNLRGLGTSRTLVLVDGKRLPFGSSQSAAPDLNQIPGQLVERIEVLTGGASAVYGADAVAGVVNFIMKRDFEGVQADAQLAIYQTGNSDSAAKQRLSAVGFDVPGSTTDGFTQDYSVIVGANLADGRGNVTAYATYRDINSIVQADRIGAACAVGGGSPDFFCLGSSTTFPARLTDFGVNGGGDKSFDLLAFDPKTFEERDFVGSGPVNDTFNFASTQRFQRPDKRWTFGAFAHYDITENMEFYLDTMFANTRSQGQIGPSGTFFRTSSINCDNPLLTAKQLKEICTDNGAGPGDRANVFIGRRDIEGGPRQQSFDNTTFRIVGGLRGSWNETWDYDITAAFSRVADNDVNRNDLVVPNLKLALDVVTGPDGTPVCRSALPGGLTPSCVPYNIFTPGGVTQEALDFILSPGFSKGSITQEVATVTMTGDLGDYNLKSPFASTGVQFLGGFEYRKDDMLKEPDNLRADGLLSGSGGKTLPVDASIDVYEFFTELAIPIAEGMQFAEEISATAAFRFSDYETTGSSSTYALGLTWMPDPMIRFRGQFQRATRSPNVFELFLSQNTGLFDISDPDGDGIFDPCAGAVPERTFEECARTGVTASQFGIIADNPAAQFNLITGGNENLEVEKSDTFTIGAIITPPMLPGLTVSVDVFDIKVKGFVGTIPPNLSLKKCLDSGDPFFCSLVQRDSGGGLFADPTTSFVVATNVNTGSLETRGVDISAAYSFDLPGNFGVMNIGYTATYLDDLITVAIPGATPFDCAGFYSSECGNPSPHYKHHMLMTYAPTSDFGVSLTWRFIGGVSQFGAPKDSTNLNARLDSETYIDLSISANVTDSMKMRIGINNLFDNNPPTSGVVPAGTGTGNTFPGFYDSRGRFGFFGLTQDF